VGRVSLVVLSFNGMGKQQGDVYSAVFAEAFGMISSTPFVQNASAPPPPSAGNPPPPPSASAHQPQLFDLHYLDGTAYSMFKWALKPGVRKTVDAVMQPFSFIKFQVSQCKGGLSSPYPPPPSCFLRSHTCPTRRPSLTMHKCTTEPCATFTSWIIMALCAGSECTARCPPLNFAIHPRTPPSARTHT